MNIPKVLILGRGARTVSKFSGMMDVLKSKSYIIYACDPDGWNDSISKKVHKKYFYWRNKLNISKNRVSKIEINLGISINQICSNYILYRDYNYLQGVRPNDYSSTDDITSRVINAYYFLQYIIKYEGEPSLILIETIDTPESYILNLIKKKAIMIESKFSGIGPIGMIPVTGLSRQNCYETYNIRINVKRDINRIIKKIFAKKNEEAINYDTWHNKFYVWNTNKKLLKKSFESLKILPSQNRGYVKYVLRTFKEKIFSRRYFYKNLSGSNNICFFLNHLPEATTFSEAPDYFDPFHIIMKLCINKPYNMTIYIKEHPRCLFRRPDNFYKRIARLPGVKLLHPQVKNLEVFKKCKAILAVTGTVGIQACTSQLQVGVLGRPFWSNAPWVTKLDKPEEIFNLAKKKCRVSVKKIYLKKLLSTVTFFSKPEKFPSNYEIGKVTAEAAYSFFLKKHDDKK